MALVQCGLSVSRAVDDRLKAIAERDGSTRAEVARRLIDIALPFVEGGLGLDFARLVTILEFCSLTQDCIMQKVAPEEADRLLALALTNAKKYHAA